MKSIYPIQNVALRYDGTAAQFADLASAPAAVLAEVQADVIAIRTAAARALGIDPTPFAHLAALPSEAMAAVIKSGPGKAKGLARFSAGKRWQSEVIENRRRGVLPSAPPQAGPAPGAAPSGGSGFLARVVAHIAATGSLPPGLGQVIENRLAAQPAGAVVIPPGESLQVTGRARAAAAFKAAFSAPPAVPSIREARPELSGSELAITAFNRQFGIEAPPPPRKSALREARPDLTGHQLASAVIGRQFGVEPPPPPRKSAFREERPELNGRDLAAAVFEKQFPKGKK